MSGKGDRDRTDNKKEFDRNFQGINWGDNKSDYQINIDTRKTNSKGKTKIFESGEVSK